MAIGDYQIKKIKSKNSNQKNKSLKYTEINIVYLKIYNKVKNIKISTQIKITFFFFFKEIEMY